MPTSYTSLLGFALPVTGELNGLWGDVVNNSITQLVEDSVAGSATASVAGGDWTLTTTGSGASNQARCAILIPTGSPGTTRNIIAPSSSKAYIVDNQSDSIVVLKGSATTGVSIAASSKALCAWNGTDFVQVGGGGIYDVQTFTSSGTWTKPAGVNQVNVIAIGGGGGGGSGSKASDGVYRTGGAGGGAGAFGDYTLNASDLTSTVSVTIGTGGTGGASVTTDSTNGNTGTAGGNTTFGSYLTIYGGGAGGAGYANSPNIVSTIASLSSGYDLVLVPPSANNAGYLTYDQNGYGTISQVNSASSNSPRGNGGSCGNRGPGSGAGGGGYNASNVGPTIMGYGGTGGILYGGYAGGTSSVTAGSNGGNGTAAPTGKAIGGGGGGAGTPSRVGNAGNGGDGALYGGGGGGGGCSLNSVGNSGAGGNGAAGICVVISW